MSLLGCRSFDIARASICRIRSRVRLKCSPTSSRVRGSPRSSPNLSFKISLSRSSRGPSNLVISSGSRATAAASSGSSAFRSSTTSQSSASPSSLRGSDNERGSAAKRRASETLSSGISTSTESSASVAGRPNLSSSRERAFWRRARVSPA